MLQYQVKAKGSNSIDDDNKEGDALQSINSMSLELKKEMQSIKGLLLSP